MGPRETRAITSSLPVFHTKMLLPQDSLCFSGMMHLFYVTHARPFPLLVTYYSILRYYTDIHMIVALR